MKTRNLIISLCLSFGILSPLFAEISGKSVSAVYTLWFPYNYQGEDGTASGFENDIFRAVMKSMGYQVKFTMLPWKRCLHSLRYGDADALVSMLKVDDRKEYTLYTSEPISISRTLLFVQKTRIITFNGSFEDLKHYSIGVTRGFSYGKQFDDAEYLQKEEVIDQKAIINKVIHGRNDIGIGNQLVIMGLAAKMGFESEIRFLEPAVHMQKLYVGFSKTKRLEKLAEEFSKSLVDFKETESYLTILERYGLKPNDLIAN